MWLSFRNVASLFNISAETVSSLREENSALKAKNTQLESELLSVKVNLDWLRLQFNQLQMERSALLNQRLGVQVPFPELAPAPPRPKLPPALEDFTFDDMGDEAAMAAGLPVYGD